MIRLLVLILLLASASALLVLNPMGGRQATTIVSLDTEHPPRYYVEDARWRQLSSSGSMQYAARAERIRYFDDHSVTMDALNMSQLDGGEVWTFSSPSAFAPAGERRILLQGPVIADGKWPSGETFTLRTDNLWVDSLRREIYTDSDVSIDGPNRHLQARGLRSDWSGSRLSLSHDVRGRYLAHD